MTQCRATSKQTGEQCKAHCVPGWPVCRHHGAGGGPKTPEGLERCRMANWKHGRRSKAAIEEQRRIKALLRQADAMLESLGG